MHRYSSALTAAGLTIIVLFALLGWMHADLEKEKMLHLSFQALVDRLSAELLSVNEKLDETELRATQAETRLSRALAEKAELEFQLTEIETRTGSTRTPSANRVDLGSVRVLPGNSDPSQNPPDTGGAEGTVMSVNGEHGFVVVNLGARQGMKEGMKLILLQNGAPAGELRVDMVDDAISAAAVIEKPKNDIRIGDAVRTAGF